MKVALVGAPGSGKTELARSLATELPNTDIVDNYIEEITNRSDVAMSHFAVYIGNMQCAIGRFEHERKAGKREGIENLVCCGSLVETSVYTAINAYTHAQGTQDAAFRSASDKRAQITMMWLSMLRADAWDYDHVFYLPLDEEYKDDEENRWATVVDEQIPAAAEALEVEMVTLSTDPDDRLAQVLEHIRENSGLQTDGPEATDAESVVVGGEGSAVQEDQSGSVPDVQDATG